MKKYPVALAIFILMFFIPALSVHALCIKVSKANLRKGPGKNYEVAWQVYMYMPLERVGRSTDKSWYAVRDADGDTFWVHKSLVTSAYKCAAVKVEKANVRKGPGTRYSRVEDSPAQKYYSYKVMSRKRSWVRLKDEWGAIGWIRRDLLWIR